MENAELRLDLNVALDGLGEMQDSIRAVPGNFAKTLQTLEALQPCRRKHTRLRVNINTVICAENFDHVLEIADFVKEHCEVDGHYFNIIRGNALDPGLKKVPSHRLPALYKELHKVYRHYAPTILKRLEGIERTVGEAWYEGTLALHNRIQLENIESPHPWPMPCTAGGTSVVIDYNGDVRGRIVLALDHEPGERDPNSPFDGVVTSEWSTLWRGVLAAQQKGARAVLFVSDVHNHPGAANFEAAARNVWPEMPARILIYTLAAWADRIHIPVAQISPALAASLVAGTGKSLELKKRYDNNASQLVRRSDQWPFLQSGVPALGFMTGLHPDYHTQYDRPEKINYPKMEKIVRLIFLTSMELANSNVRLRFTAD